jgi:hypothetical protein
VQKSRCPNVCLRALFVSSKIYGWFVHREVNIPTFMFCEPSVKFILSEDTLSDWTSTLFRVYRNNVAVPTIVRHLKEICGQLSVVAQKRSDCLWVCDEAILPLLAVEVALIRGKFRALRD